MNFLRETWIVVVRSLRLSVRTPAWVFLGLVQPLLYLVLFGPLLERVVEATPDLPPGNTWQIFVPGLLVQLGLFGTAFVGFGVIAERRSGVLCRLQATPVHRSALLLGRVLRDVLVLVIQAILLVAAAMPFGLRLRIPGAALALLIVVLLGAAFASLSYAAALALKSEDALAPALNGTAVPLLLLSGVLLPMSLAPRWLRTLSEINPLSHVVNAMRTCFVGQPLPGGTLPGLGWAVCLCALGLVAGTWAFHRESV
jgi:ABC-2 type transport system permease protein